MGNPVFVGFLVGVLGVLFVFLVIRLLTEAPSKSVAPPPAKPVEAARTLPVQPRTTTDEQTPPPPPSPGRSSFRLSGPEDQTAPSFPTTEPETSPSDGSSFPAFAIPTPDAIRVEEERDPAVASKMWERIARWEDAARCYEKLGDLDRSASIWLGLGKRERAIPILEKALAGDPANEALRLKTIEALMDLGRIQEAEVHIQAVSPVGVAHRASGPFFDNVGRDFEAVSENTKAFEYYRLAMSRGDKSPEVQQRALLLKVRHRLAKENPPEPGALSPAQEILERYIRESSIVQLPPPGGYPVSAALEGHEIVVGHLALGFQAPEPACSVRSVFSLSRRYVMERLLTEKTHNAVFMGRDKLLDFPVAVKLQRLPDDAAALEYIRQRFRVIAALNHPNLAKVTFVDRDGPILRVATEFLPGGNLRDFLQRLGGIGIPLLIRMSMHLASALHFAHTRGVPHGDLRPENILISSDQRLKLTDFAIRPIPIARPELSRSPIGDIADTPRSEEFFAKNEGVQSDLLQFAEIFQFLLDHSRKPGDAINGTPSGPDPLEELKELVQRVHNGGFTSILRLWQVLEQIFDRTMPQMGSSESRNRG